MKTLATPLQNVNSLDTLAQPGTNDKKPPIDGDFIVVSQESTNQSTLLKRARAKYLTNAIVFQLASVESPLNKSYWNSFHCSKNLTMTNGKITGEYCKNRWCMVCNRIRTAQLINTYQPVINSWPDKHFLTLTIPNVKGEFLPFAIERMNAEIKKILSTLKKRAQRKKLSFPRVQGFRKLECTYNPIRNDYHPHFHIITDSLYGAVEIREMWLKRFPSAKEIAQHISPADDKTSIELFKYFTKVLTKTGGTQNEEKKYKIEPYVLDKIFRAIKGCRTFQPFGCNGLSRIDKTDEGESSCDSRRSDLSVESILDTIVYEWEQEFSDWVDKATGETLSGYEPSEKMRKLTE